MKTRTHLLAGISSRLLALACILALALQSGVVQAAPAPKATNFIIVTVKAGDNLSKYTFLYGVTGSALIQANNFKDPNLIFPGQQVVVPVIKSFTPSLTTPFFYVVQSGDAVDLLGRRFEMDPSIIAAANSLQNDVITLGATILIPAGPHSHFAVAGETLKIIAARYGILVSVLISNNPGITNPDLIFIGQPIFVPILYGAQPVPLSGGPAPTPIPVTPTPTVTPGGPTPTNTPVPSATPNGAANFIQVTVRSGESFVTYVTRYGVSGHPLRNANPQIADPNLIFPGQVIVVPVIVSFTPSRTTPFFYVVVGGDTTASIAAQFEMGADVLTANNPGASFAAGATILVPAGPHLYTVRPGDSLGVIAARYATIPDFLLGANKLPANDLVFPGELIFVPVQLDKIPAPFN